MLSAFVFKLLMGYFQISSIIAEKLDKFYSVSISREHLSLGAKFWPSLNLDRNHQNIAKGMHVKARNPAQKFSRNSDREEFIPRHAGLDLPVDIK